MQRCARSRNKNRFCSHAFFCFRELREEAGVNGVIGRDLGTCGFPCDTRWFMCEFVDVLEQEEWLEHKHRRRRLFSVEEAARELCWKPWMLLVLHAATHCMQLSRNNVTFMRASSLWNGNAAPIEHNTCFSLVIHPRDSSSVVIAIQSTDHRNMHPPSPPNLEGTDGLWNYEARSRCQHPISRVFQLLKIFAGI